MDTISPHYRLAAFAPKWATPLPKTRRVMFICNLIIHIPATVAVRICRSSCEHYKPENGSCRKMGVRVC